MLVVWGCPWTLRRRWRRSSRRVPAPGRAAAAAGHGRRGAAAGPWRDQGGRAGGGCQRGHGVQGRGGAGGGGEPLGRARRPGGGRKRRPRPTRGGSGAAGAGRPQSRGTAVAAAVDDQLDPPAGRVLAAAGHRFGAYGVVLLRQEGALSRRPMPRLSKGASTPTGTPSSGTSTARPGTTWTPADPVISVDAKKKRTSGRSGTAAPDGGPTGEPEKVNVHDFIDKELGKVTPTGSTMWPRMPGG